MNYKNYNDYELIYMVRENDYSSYNVLYDKYLPVIKNISRKYYNMYTNFGYDYDDFFQEGCLGFQKALTFYNENKDILFYSFVVLCVNRTLVSFCKKITSKRKGVNLYDYLDIDDYQISESKYSVNEIIDELDVLEYVKKIILDLPIKDSSVFELKFNGFTHLEISKLLDIPVSTVDYRIRKCRKLFANYYY